MSNLRIKQISNAGASGGSVIAFDGRANIWQKLNHVQQLTADDLDEDGLVVIVHSLGRKYVHVTLYDENDEMVMPDMVKVIDDETAMVKLSSFATSITEWVVFVS